MPGELIGNAPGAFGLTSHPQSGTQDEFNSGATAIPGNNWTGLDTTGTTNHVYGVTQGLHGANANTAISVAGGMGIASGFTGKAVVRGPGGAIAGTGGVTAGNLLTIDPNAAHDGQVIAATGTVVVGTVIGMALTTATVGNPVSVWVFKA